MRVRIDSAGDDQTSFCVDCLVGFDVDLLADHGHFAVFDEDVGVVIVDGGDDAAVGDDRFHGGVIVIYTTPGGNQADERNPP